MSTPKKKTTIEVSPGTAEKLKEEKISRRLKSLDAVIQTFLPHPQGGGEEAHAEAPVQDDSPGEKKKRKKNVRDPLYSSELIDEREGMLKHLTGFERPEVEKLTKRFKEVGIV